MRFRFNYCTMTPFYMHNILWLRSIFWFRQYSKKMCLHAQQLWEHSSLQVYQRTLNKPEMDTAGGKSVMMLVARCVVLVLVQKKISSHTRKWTLFPSQSCIILSTLQLNDNTYSSPHAEQWKTRMRASRGMRLAPDTREQQLVAKACVTNCAKCSNRNIYCDEGVYMSQ